MAEVALGLPLPPGQPGIGRSPLPVERGISRGSEGVRGRNGRRAEVLLVMKGKGSDAKNRGT